MLAELVAAALGGGAGAYGGARWAQGRLARVVTKLHLLLDELEVPARRLDTLAIPSPDKLDLEARALYQEGLTAWTPEALDRLLKAVREVPLCESCRLNQATLVVTWADVDSPGGDEFITCHPCAAMIPGGVAKVENLIPDPAPRSGP